MLLLHSKCYCSTSTPMRSCVVLRSFFRICPRRGGPPQIYSGLSIMLFWHRIISFNILTRLSHMDTYIRVADITSMPNIDDILYTYWHYSVQDRLDFNAWECHLVYRDVYNLRFIKMHTKTLKSIKIINATNRH